MLSKIEDAIEDLKVGRPVILVDDEDRENEGDFVVAGQFITPELITLMTREASGIITVPMSEARLQQLELDLMVFENEESMRTAFTVTVDARKGISTGSSAFDRALTIRKLAEPGSTAKDFVRPGHVNPLRARAGGVLKRPGHTEAAIDLMKFAGLVEVAVICEIMNDKGEMARLPELERLAEKHSLKLISIAELIRFRRISERLIEKVAVTKLPTKYGVFTAHAYLSEVDDNEYLALVMGEPSADNPTLCRIHSSCVTGDLLDSLRCDCGDQLHLALKRIQEEGCGVLLYIEQEGRGIGLVNKMRAYQLQDSGQDTVQANLSLGFKPDERDFGIGAQILVDLGLKKLRLMTNNPRKLSGLEGFGLSIEESLPLETEPNEHNLTYLKTKREKLGHRLKCV
jgi:3,4-dihydroxy 2-butanone 4-phosphate synthase/GTP cyclohydrolase II